MALIDMSVARSRVYRSTAKSNIARKIYRDEVATYAHKRYIRLTGCGLVILHVSNSQKLGNSSDTSRLK